MASVHKALEGPLPGRITRSVEVELAQRKNMGTWLTWWHMSALLYSALLVELKRFDIPGIEMQDALKLKARKEAHVENLQFRAPPHSSNFGHCPWLQKINNAHMNDLDKLSNQESRCNKLSQLLAGHLLRWSETSWDAGYKFPCEFVKHGPPALAWKIFANPKLVELVSPLIWMIFKASTKPWRCRSWGRNRQRTFQG